MNVIEVIANYLRSNRRLVVPTFGAFVVKDSGNILFSELLKTDDGVLRGLLSAGGLSELEIAVLIDRFIFDARNALSEDGYFDMDGLGRLTIGANGEMKFVSSTVKPVESAVVEPCVRNAVPEAKPDAAKPAMQTERRKPAPIAATDDYDVPKKRGVDWFVVIAVVVLLAAVSVIIYGYFCSAGQDDEMMMDSLRWQIEQTEPDNK